MKKIFLALTIAAFAVAAQAGASKDCKDKACTHKDKAACAAQGKTCSADKSACCANKASTAKKPLLSPRAASLAAR